jgi:hypothetical protein
MDRGPAFHVFTPVQIGPCVLTAPPFLLCAGPFFVPSRRADRNEKPRRFGRTGCLDGEIAGSWGAKRSLSVRLSNLRLRARFPFHYGRAQAREPNSGLIVIADAFTVAYRVEITSRRLATVSLPSIRSVFSLRSAACCPTALT